MLNLDNNYSHDNSLHVAYSQPMPKEINQALYLSWGKEKYIELAWALVYIMNMVHIARHLYNDISPDNIMFHFPKNDSCVYIGVCHWGITTIGTKPIKSLYKFTFASDKGKALRERWWVDPSTAYVHRRNTDVEIIYNFSRK